MIAGTQRRADIEGEGKRIAELEAGFDRQSVQHEVKIEQERREHAAELQIMRHRMNNLDQCMTMLLALIELNPERARDSATWVRQMRERQEANEIAEKGAITATSPKETPEGCAIRLDKRLAGFAQGALACTPPLRGHDEQWAAVTSLSYNIGSAAYCRSTVDRRFDAGDRRGAATPSCCGTRPEAVRSPGSPTDAAPSACYD